MNTERPTIEFEMSIADVREVLQRVPLAELLEGKGSPAHKDRVGPYRWTYTGVLFFPCDPRPAEVFIADIARGLSSQPRFTGLTKNRVNVAEHSWICSHHGPKETALERLMHDAPEAYIGDLIRPMKVIPIFGDIYLKVEDGIMQAIAKRYSLQYPFPKDVYVADEAAVHTEMLQNINGANISNSLIDLSLAPDDMPLQYWEPKIAEEMFLHRFKELAGERGIVTV